MFAARGQHSGEKGVGRVNRQRAGQEVAAVPRGGGDTGLALAHDHHMVAGATEAARGGQRRTIVAVGDEYAHLLEQA